jgi:hypothetical protein
VALPVFPAGRGGLSAQFDAIDVRVQGQSGYRSEGSLLPLLIRKSTISSIDSGGSAIVIPSIADLIQVAVDKEMTRLVMVQRGYAAATMRSS